jgi:hypothetical protein
VEGVQEYLENIARSLSRAEGRAFKLDLQEMHGITNGTSLLKKSFRFWLNFSRGNTDTDFLERRFSQQLHENSPHLKAAK